MVWYWKILMRTRWVLLSFRLSWDSIVEISSETLQGLLIYNSQSSLFNLAVLQEKQWKIKKILPWGSHWTSEHLMLVNVMPLSHILFTGHSEQPGWNPLGSWPQPLVTHLCEWAVSAVNRVKHISLWGLNLGQEYERLSALSLLKGFVNNWINVCFSRRHAPKAECTFL